MTVVEGTVDEHSRALAGVREAVTGLEQRMDTRFEAVDRRFEGLERRMDTLDDKISRHFTWVVGIQVTTLVAIVAALLAR